MNLFSLLAVTYETSYEFEGTLPAWAMAAIIIGGWIFSGLVIMGIARNTGTPNGWMAFIPILNAVLLCQCAGKPGWWFLLLLVPLVNIVIPFIIWINIAERCGRPGWWGVVICLIPIVNLILALILAFGSPPQTRRVAY